MKYYKYVVTSIILSVSIYGVVVWSNWSISQPQNNMAQHTANHFIRQIIYIKDPRTNQCFAYGLGDTGSGFSYVPCESIPPTLLNIAKVE